MLSLTEKKDFLFSRLSIIQSIRDFFVQKGFCEVDTPTLQKSPGLEVHLKAFQTILKAPFLEKEEKRFLNTSPEFAMKKLLSGGMDKIFQICHSYRNEETSPYHLPEFTMLEFYQSEIDFLKIIELTEKMIKKCAKKLGTLEFNHLGKKCPVFGKWQRLSVNEAFKKYAHFDVFKTIDDELSLEPNPNKIAKEAKKLGIQIDEKDTWEDIFFRIMLEKIEPYLGIKKPTFLYDYPVCLGALAKTVHKKNWVAERTELYILGVEIGNGYSELTEAAQYKQRFSFVQKKQKEIYGFTYPVDETFLKAIETNFPKCAGIAIGVDRVVMLLTGAQSIQDVSFFSDI